MNTSVYIHIPICPSKCHYCDFLSFAKGCAHFSAGQYLELLEGEMALRGDKLKAGGYLVGTLYIGGGTPTVLEPGQLEFLLQCCRRYLPLALTEWSVEANPGTITEQKALLLAEYGVNRISLGVQDTDDERLAMLGRSHTAAQAKQAFFLCREHFPQVSVDLMTGLPKQSTAQVREALTELCSWQPDHLSMYGLKVEEGTKFAAMLAAEELVLPSEEETLAMMLAGREVLLQHGYEHYEIANFSLPQKACRHNLTYWRNHPYLGIGMGAHSFWQGARLQNTAQWQEYSEQLKQGNLPIVEHMHVSQRHLMEDTMMLGLRLMAGVRFADFYNRFGCDLRQVFAKEIALLAKQGLIACDEQSIRLTTSGYPLANMVFAQFITV